MAPKDSSHNAAINTAVNAGLLLVMLVLCIAIVNIIVSKTGALGGISFTEALADEFRIRLMPVPRQPMGCMENLTHFSPRCEADFLGGEIRLPKSHLAINSLGFRGIEYSLEKREGIYRTFVLGDSFAFGSGVNDDEAFPSVIEQLLSAQRADLSFDVWNLGMPGASTENEYARLLSYLAYDPNLVVLQTLFNDVYECKAFRESVNAALGIGDEREMILDRDEMVETRKEWGGLREEYAKEISWEERCRCVRENLDSIINITRGRGIPLIIYDSSSEGEKSCFLVEDVQGVIYVEQAQLVERRFHLSRKDTHPNREGHRKMAEELVPHVIDALNLSETLQKI